MKPNEVLERFTHIDADFVGCQLGFGIKDCFLKVSFYAWWEHPKYLKAIRGKKKWAFQMPDEANREVVVRPTGLIEFKVSNSQEIIDWDFPGSHPALWRYQNREMIYPTFLHPKSHFPELAHACDKRWDRISG
ncbi:MAG: hypothetical protein ABI036_16780 [Fibrobacteria bacterium]